MKRARLVRAVRFLHDRSRAPSPRAGGRVIDMRGEAPNITLVPRGAPEGAEIPPAFEQRRGDPLNLIRVMPAKGQDIHADNVDFSRQARWSAVCRDGAGPARQSERLHTDG